MLSLLNGWAEMQLKRDSGAELTVGSYLGSLGR